MQDLTTSEAIVMPSGRYLTCAMLANILYRMSPTYRPPLQDTLSMRRLAPTAVVVFSFLFASAASRADDPWVVYDGGEGPGKGKHVVLISGDEEYRSEEALPQLGKILSQHHGFKCTVLFAIDPESGRIDPNVGTNIPGTEALDSADLMIVFLRFRNLPDDQMAPIQRYLAAGKPVIGLRTSTHAFNVPGDSKWARYGNGYNGDQKAWQDGFGRLVLGEKWISHHGHHKAESTRGIIAEGAKDHPITHGLKDGDVWGSSDVYGVRLPLPGDSMPLVLGQVMKRTGPQDGNDVWFGMRPDDAEPVEGKKNDPMMPVAWTKSYKLPDGKQGRAFTTTLGASSDLLIEGTRRLIVNACYWAVGLEDEIPSGGAAVDIVGEFEPTQYSFRDKKYWPERDIYPSDFALKGE